jgi:ABC-type glycerol-3-phosphate transport system substrate-binding protein
MHPLRFIGAAATILLLSASLAVAQDVPGKTADERALNGARAYMKAKGLTSLKLNMMMPSIFTAGSTAEMATFEKETGVGVNYFEVGILQIQAKAMSEAVAKSGSFDFWIGDPISLPDLAEAGLARPIDDFVAKGKPDLDDIVAGFQEQGRYKGKTYGIFADGDNFIMVIRRDLTDKPEEKQKFKAKYGWEPNCPDTYQQWMQLAEFYTRDPKGTGVPELYGAMGYRARGWGWRWWLQQFYAKGGLPFDDGMKPLIAGREGVEALKDYIALTKYMPKDILGWATPQAYPFYAGGNAFSIMTTRPSPSPPSTPRSRRSRARTTTAWCPATSSTASSSVAPCRGSAISSTCPPIPSMPRRPTGLPSTWRARKCRRAWWRGRTPSTIPSASRISPIPA